MVLELIAIGQTGISNNIDKALEPGACLGNANRKINF
jgi:hypothetical protein